MADFRYGSNSIGGHLPFVLLNFPAVISANSSETFSTQFIIPKFCFGCSFEKVRKCVKVNCCVKQMDPLPKMRSLTG